MKRAFTGTRASVLATAGIVLVLALITVYQIVSRQEKLAALSRVERSSDLAAAYQSSQVSLAQIELSVYRLTVMQDPAVLAMIPEQVDAVMRDTGHVKELGDASDRALVDGMYESYLGALRLLKVAASSGVNFATLRPQLPGDNVGDTIRAQLAQKAQERRAEADSELEDYRRSENFRLAVVVVLNVAGFALVLLLVVGLRFFSRREAHLSAMMAAQAELELARDEADRANQAKSQFLSRMSHELRTPMNAVLGFGQLLEMDNLTQPQRENVAFIMRSGRHLLRLIDEVLDISRIEAGRLSLSLEPFVVRDVMREVLSMSSPMAQEHGIDLEGSCGTEETEWRAVGDVQRTKQVLLNLVSNAIKYNSPGGTVLVSGEELDSGEVRISVRDTGNGISADALPRLFSPFDRLDATATEIEGTGLGLALSKALVEAMNGRLEVLTEVGAGSTFSVVLPSAHVVVTAPADVAEFAGQLTALTSVVCLEDNVASYQVVQSVLSKFGVEAVRVGSAANAVASVLDARPGVVLVDLHLADGDGLSVIRALRGEPRTAAIPIIVVSADVTEPARRDALALGANAFVPKPVDVRCLLEALASVIQEPGNATRAA